MRLVLFLAALSSLSIVTVNAFDQGAIDPTRDYTVEYDLSSYNDTNAFCEDWNTQCSYYIEEVGTAYKIDCVTSQPGPEILVWCGGNSNNVEDKTRYFDFTTNVMRFVNAETISGPTDASTITTTTSSTTTPPARTSATQTPARTSTTKGGNVFLPTFRPPAVHPIPTPKPLSAKEKAKKLAYWKALAAKVFEERKALRAKHERRVAERRKESERKKAVREKARERKDAARKKAAAKKAAARAAAKKAAAKKAAAKKAAAKKAAAKKAAAKKAAQKKAAQKKAAEHKKVEQAAAHKKAEAAKKKCTKAHKQKMEQRKKQH